MNNVKVSKWRHVGVPSAPKADQLYTQVKNSTTVWELSNFMACSSENMAMAWASTGGGRLSIIPYVPGKLQDPPSFTGHSAPILDWAFHPYNENLIASSSEDCTVRLWTIPEGGLKSNESKETVLFTGHGKKVGILRYHVSANHVLISAGMDNLIKYWDIENGEKFTLDCHKDQILSIDQNLDGSQIVTSSKDRKLRIIDPRGNTVVQETEAHQGQKSQKVVWAKRKDKIISVGFSKSQERQVYVHDPRKFDTKLYEMELDNQSGVMMTFYDEDLNMLWLGGKGDGNIRYYELWENDPPLTPCSEFGSSTPQKGLGLMPKWTCNTSACEVAKFMRLEADKIVPLTFVCPRKEAAVSFQKDVYPETFSNQPAQTAAEFFSGNNAAPLLLNMESIQSEKPASLSASFKAPSEKPISKTDVDAQEAKVNKLKADLAKEEETLKQMKEKLAAK
jgi:hypothetical protein